MADLFLSILDATNGGQDRYSKTAKLLTIIVLAYVIQMSPTVVTCIWDVVDLIRSEPGSPIQAKLVVVIVTSMGGIYNGIAYTAIRRKESSQQ